MFQRVAFFCALLGTIGLLSNAAVAEDTTMFPFLISYDAPDNATNIANWLHKPAGKHGFVRAEGGKLATDAGPLRLWATNLCFDACFPTHEQAEAVAARMARFGINCVRMHHMDNRSIWGNSPDRLTIDPDRMERLDYLIHQLKQHGIYTNINLHVSRTFGANEGFPVEGGRPKYDKGIDNFHPRMIELQRKYASDLLTHTNPYTKNAYINEPAVAMVEINNENALFNQWSRQQLNALEDPYASEFRRQWNDWLKDKYGSTEQLRSVWNKDSMPLGDDQLQNGDFSEPLANIWVMERDAETKATWEIVDGGPQVKRCLRIVVENQGKVTWHPQLKQAGISVQKGKPYTLSCYLRSAKPASVGWNCMMNHDPWQRLGLSAQAQIGPEWKQYEFTFLAEQDDDNARITLSSLQPETYELADVTFRSGGIVGVKEGQSLEDHSIPIMLRGASSLVPIAQQDFIDFLWDTEHAYWLGMYDFLVNELKVRSPVSGTQLSYSPTWIQAQLDYLDAHAYWQHPSFPGRAWDSRNWYVGDKALVNNPGGTLTSLAARRVAGMAYTISEYNHPTPITYEAEGLPMIAAFGAFQDWDGIFSFAYAHNTDFQPARLGSYFDIKANAVKLAHHPACAAMFLRGDVLPASKTFVTPMTKQDERDSLNATGDPWRLARDRFGTDPNQALVHGVALKLAAAADRPAEDPTSTLTDTKTFISDTGQLRWDVSIEGAGYFTANTPRTKLFTGFVRDRRFSLGDVALRIGETRKDWATVSAVCIDGQGFDQPGRILVTATGLMENTDAQRDQLENNRVTLQRGWGKEPLLCEGIPAQLLLPIEAGRVVFYALDPSGNRVKTIPVQQRQEKAVLTLLPEYRTIWYEAVLR